MRGQPCNYLWCTETLIQSDSLFVTRRRRKGSGALRKWERENKPHTIKKRNNNNHGQRRRRELSRTSLNPSLDPGRRNWLAFFVFLLTLKALKKLSGGRTWAHLYHSSYFMLKNAAKTVSLPLCSWGEKCGQSGGSIGCIPGNWNIWLGPEGVFYLLCLRTTYYSTYLYHTRI